MKHKKVLLFTSSIKSYLFYLLVFGILFQVQAQDYPFVIDDNITATLDVQTTNQETFKNPLLGYNIFGFNTATEQEFIRKFDPTTIRFPHGLFANWYDWRTDGTRVFGEETFDYIDRNGVPKEATIDQLTAINYFDSSGKKVGVDGLEQLNKEREQAQGKMFDVIWTFNMSADSEAGANTTESPETVARYQDLIARDFDVKDIELGNENFYPGQRSSFIPNASDYIARAKSMSQDLKAIDPTIQVSIPLLRRDSWVDPNWNSKLTQDLTYFDAVTVHTYIGSDPDNAANTDDAYSTALTARKSLETSTNDFVRVYTGDKPIWLTEWGVKSGDANAASVLGMADCYLFMAENQDIYHRANWFSVNGKLNSFVVWDGNNIKYPLEKTAYGLTHEILKTVFENSTMLESTMTTLNLEDDVKAVSARAVTKDGKTTVFVLNLTDKQVPFTLNMDGTLYNDAFIHKAMQFDNVGQERELPFDEDPMSVIKEGSGAIMLPPLSISTIYLGSDDDAQLPTVGLTSPLPYSTHYTDVEIPLAATATDSDGTIMKVAFKINDVLHNVADTSAPYEETFTPTESGTYKISAVATDNDGKTTEVYTLIYVAKKGSYTGTPSVIPGIIEAENYDIGGQDVAYNDTDAENDGGVYRDEGVDIGAITGGGYSVAYIAGGEWLNYTVNVEVAGKYDLIIKYASGKDGGGTISASMNDADLFSDFTLLQTAGWSDYKTLTVEDLTLEQGVQVLKLTMGSRGYNIDNIEFKLGTLAVEDFETTKIVVYPNPSNNGVFSISKSLSWQIFNITGAKLMEGEGDIIDLSRFPKGLYILKSGSEAMKLIVQ